MKQAETSTFWINKPMMKTSSMYPNCEHIVDLKNKPIYTSDVPMKLPPSMTWKQIDNYDDVISFLNEHDDSGITYSTSLLKWIINNGELIAIMDGDTVCGVVGYNIKHITIFSKEDQQMVNLCILCAHPTFRNKNIFHVLIEETIRRCVKKGYNVGMFLTNRRLPNMYPSAAIRYYQRPINYKKLHDTGYMVLQRSENDTDVEKQNKIDKFINLFDIPNTPSISCIPATMEHLQYIQKLHNKWNTRFNVHNTMTTDEIENTFFGDNVKTYMMCDGDNVVDFFSYSILKHNKGINTSFVLTYTSNTILVTNVIDTIIKIAKNDDIDIVYLPDTMTTCNVLATSNEIGYESDANEYDAMYDYKIFKKNKLMLYFFNYKYPQFKSSQISVIFNNPCISHM